MCVCSYKKHHATYSSAVQDTNRNTKVGADPVPIRIVNRSGNNHTRERYSNEPMKYLTLSSSHQPISLRYTIGKLLRRIQLSITSYHISHIISEGSRPSHCGTDKQQGAGTRQQAIGHVPKASVTAQNEGTRYKQTTLTFPIYLYVVRGQEALLVDMRSPSFQPYVKNMSTSSRHVCRKYLILMLSALRLGKPDSLPCIRNGLFTRYCA